MANGIEKDNAYGILIEDAERRDFTANSIYYDPINHKFFDLYDGIKDIKNKQLCVIGSPEIRFKEDPVRILRAIRFSAKLALKIEPKTRKILNTRINLLDNIPYSKQ